MECGLVWGWGFFACLCFKKKESGENGPPVYNGLAVRIITHRYKEFDFKPFCDWWSWNP